MGELRPWHIVVIVVVAFVLFGYKKLPDATRSLGRSLRILKTEVKTLHEEDPDKTEATAVKVEKPAVAEAPRAAVAPRAVEAPRATVPEAVAPVAARAPIAPADSDLH
jgi:sec-independent protein translocase protein TatA